MFGFLKKLFAGDTEQIAEAIRQGGTILDVRSSMEFKSGSVKGAVNIPHTDIRRMKSKIAKMQQPIIVCCASGMRSGAALHDLQELGYKAYNGKTWQRVNAIKQGI